MHVSKNIKTKNDHALIKQMNENSQQCKHTQKKKNGPAM